MYLSRFPLLLIAVSGLFVAACDRADEDASAPDDAAGADRTASPSATSGGTTADQAADNAAQRAAAWVHEQQRFLADFAARDGVAVSPGGVYYRVLRRGEGKVPTLGDVVRVHYEGRLVNGIVFDSSYDRGAPAEFPSDRLIKGWQEILTMMHEGGKWEIAIPADLAYGKRGAGDVIPPDSALVFTLELLEIKG